MISLIKKYIGTIIIVLITIGIYVFATDILKSVDSILFPSLSKISSKFQKFQPKLWGSLLSSIKILVPGYFGAAFLGILIGTLLGTHPRANKNLQPIIFALNPIPSSMLTPYLIATMPTFYLASVSIIFIGCFWPFLNSTISGIVQIDQRYLDNAKVLEITGIKKIFNILLPAAAPSIFAGGRQALNLAFILLAVAEMFATNSGLGYFIQYYADYSDYAAVLSGLLFLSIFIVFVMTIYEKIKGKVIFWSLNENK